MTKKKYFAKGELLLWSCSVIIITVSFVLFERHGFVSWKRMKKAQQEQ